MAVRQVRGDLLCDALGVPHGDALVRRGVVRATDRDLDRGGTLADVVPNRDPSVVRPDDTLFTLNYNHWQCMSF